MMSKAYCHNGYCKPFHRTHKEIQPEIALAEPQSTLSFIVNLVGISVIAFIVSFIGGFSAKIFTL